MNFNLYGRYKDLKYVEYDSFDAPNNSGKQYGNSGYTSDDAPKIVQGMREYVKKKGINNMYVPGYTDNGSKRMPVTSIAVDRIAWAMAMSRLKNAKVRNRKRGWYNEAKAVITNKAGAELRKRVREFAINTKAAQAMGKEIVL